jgi:hypothetical protein
MKTDTSLNALSHASFFLFAASHAPAATSFKCGKLSSAHPGSGQIQVSTGTGLFSNAKAAIHGRPLVQLCYRYF